MASVLYCSRTVIGCTRGHLNTNKQKSYTALQRASVQYLTVEMYSVCISPLQFVQVGSQGVSKSLHSYCRLCRGTRIRARVFLTRHETSPFLYAHTVSRFLRSIPSNLSHPFHQSACKPIHHSTNRCILSTSPYGLLGMLESRRKSLSRTGVSLQRTNPPSSPLNPFSSTTIFCSSRPITSTWCQQSHPCASRIIKLNCKISVFTITSLLVLATTTARFHFYPLALHLVRISVDTRQVPVTLNPRHRISEACAADSAPIQRAHVHHRVAGLSLTAAVRRARKCEGVLCSLCDRCKQEEEDKEKEKEDAKLTATLLENVLSCLSVSDHMTRPGGEGHA